MGYPGETAVIDTTGSNVAFYGNTNNVYVDKLTIQNFTTHFGIAVSGDSNDVVIRRKIFQNINPGWGGEGTNASGLFISRGGSMGTNYTVVGNTFQHVHDVGYGILGYFSTNVLVQGNTCTSQTQDIEVSYNLVQVASGNTFLLGQAAVPYGAVTSFRNTWQGAPVEVDNLTSGGPVSFANDVMVTNTGLVYSATSVVSSLLLKSNLLSGTTATGILDSSGNLTSSYTKYLGIDGYQRVGSPSTGGGGGGTTAAIPDPP